MNSADVIWERGQLFEFFSRVDALPEPLFRCDCKIAAKAPSADTAATINRAWVLER